MNSAVLNMKPDIESLETGIPHVNRRQLADRLSAVLADTILLQLKSQVYHWNVVGPLFKPIHDLTEVHYRDLFEAVDVIAERIRALGYPAPQSFTDLVPKTALDEESKIRSAQEMVEQLMEDHEAIVRRLRETAKCAEALDDYATHDLLTARLAFHEKAIWMLRATITE